LKYELENKTEIFGYLPTANLLKIKAMAKAANEEVSVDDCQLLFVHCQLNQELLPANFFWFLAPFANCPLPTANF
jgi:hypothetical protein